MNKADSSFDVGLSVEKNVSAVVPCVKSLEGRSFTEESIGEVVVTMDEMVSEESSEIGESSDVII